MRSLKVIFWCLIVIFAVSFIKCAPVGQFILTAANADPEGRKIISKQSSVKVELLEQQINSTAGESHPVITPDGKSLYFGRSKGGNFFDYKIYHSQKKNGKWQEPIKLGDPPNMNDQNFVGSFTSDHQTFAFTSHNSGGFNKDNQSKIYIAQKKDSSFIIQEELDFFKGRKGWGFNPLNRKWNLEGQILYESPCLSADGTQLFFSCNLIEGGYGAHDLYVCQKDKNGQWGIPQNLGPTVNSPFMDVDPFLYPDNQTLFFSSNGHPGLGKMDIYCSKMKDGQWTSPELLGSPINSPGTDKCFSISPVGNKIYFASDRVKEHDYNIYRSTLPQNLISSKVILLSGIIFDGKTKKTLRASVVIEDLNRSEKIAELNSDPLNGYYCVPLNSGRHYSISASLDGYSFYSMDFEVEKNDKTDTIYQDIELIPLNQGETFILNNLFFESGSAQVRKESNLELKRLANLLKKNPELKIEIAGHTDNVGSKKSNLILSENRAKSVMSFLAKEGISAVRMKTKGYGMSKPVASNDTKDGRKKNRRVEIKIL